MSAHYQEPLSYRHQQPLLYAPVSMHIQKCDTAAAGHLIQQLHLAECHLAMRASSMLVCTLGLLSGTLHARVMQCLLRCPVCADGLKSTSDSQFKKSFTDVYSYSQLQVR